MSTVVYDHQIFGLQRVGGVSRYFCELAARVNKVPDFATCVIAPVHFNEYLARNTAPRQAKYLPMRIAGTGRLYRAVNTIVTPVLTNMAHGDILHRTYYWGGHRPKNAKLAVTVFDMIHELFPHHMPPGDSTARLKRRAVAEADAVLAISQSTARDLVRLLGVPVDKVFVTPLGYSREVFFSAAELAPSHNSTRPYLLYVGLRGGYKNFVRLLDAYGGSARLARDFDLIAFGGPPFTDDEMARISALKVRPGAIGQRSGSDAELARAYREAHALIYPSEYEGFGIPPLEAMSSGCPVICSDVSAVSEVVGDAGQYFNPFDVESIRSAIERVAYDSQRRTVLIECGRRRCQAFSWDKCADKTVAVYRRLLA
jgi:glycosyltransferase involved in cell wall biosynthesis